MNDLLERFGRHFPAGHALFREGDPGTEMYVIQTGRVRLVRVIRGKERLLAELGPGEFFGEMSIINDKPRTASAVTLEASSFLVLAPKTFESMIRANTEIAVRMMKRLAARLDDANTQIENLLLGDTKSRVVHALVHLCDDIEPEADGTVQAPLGITEIASRIGIEEENVRDVLERFARAALVRIDGDELVVVDPAKLTEFLKFLDARALAGDV